MTITRRSNRRPRGVAGVALSAALALGVVACGGGSAETGAGASASTPTTAAPTTATVVPDSAAAGAGTVLSDEERTGLLYMVEEEKLAHDVYVTLGAEWDLPTFENISSSETTHTARVQALLDTYGIADPTEGLDIGEFSDPAFTALYDELVARGLTSVTEALTVGAEIEELDIVDLDARAAQTDVAALDAVYAELRSGSENHLRAFTRALDARGVTYEPTLLDQADYDAVLAASASKGKGRA